MPRFSFIILVLLSSVLGCENQPPSLPEPDVRPRPNFIIFVTDDVRYDALAYAREYLPGAARFPWAETPNLDQIASEGLHFRNAFVTTSLCSPSRASILTGRYMHGHGIEDNSTDFHAESFATELQENGYHTAYFGKWHMGKQSGPRPGFDHSYSFVGQGDYFDTPFELNGQEQPSTGWVDQVTSEAFLNYLQDNATGPFCYMVGFKSCHGPWGFPPEETKPLYQGPGFDPLPVPNLDIPPVYDTDELYSSEAYNERFLWQDRNYFRYLKAIDTEMGRVNEALEDLGLWDKTYVIFMSDNGFYMGEHMLRDKRTLYEESLRIPLLVKGPGVAPGTVREELVLNLDVAPTILDLAGINTSLPMDGASWRPLFDNASTEWREDFFGEYLKEPIGPQANILGLRNERYKLVHYEDQPEWSEFYDLQNDPYEIDNRINDPVFEDIINQMNERMANSRWRRLLGGG